MASLLHVDPEDLHDPAWVDARLERDPQIEEITPVGSAQREILIFSRKLRPDVFGDPQVMAAVRAALLNTRVKIQIVTVQTHEDDCGPIFQLIQEFGPDKLRLISNKDIENCRASFTVVDETSYRLVREPKSETAEVDRWAVVNFNGKEVAARLATIFKAASTSKAASAYGNDSATPYGRDGA